MKHKIFCKECSAGLFKYSSHSCFKCKRIFCGKHIFQRVDESNRAITKSAPYLCKECYLKEYRY